MSLVKCNECGHDVSTNATSCPNCGNPISVVPPVVPDPDSISNEPVEVERTSKKFKKWKLIGVFTLILGICVLPSKTGLGVSILFFGFMILIYAAMGAWWRNG